MSSKQRERVLKCLGPGVLPLRRLRKFDRKAYEYKLVYRLLADGGEAADSHLKIKTLKLECKKHRTITKANMTALKTPTKRH
jgi:hypothetical protein